MKKPNIVITPEVLKIISSIDEFKGEWKTIKNLLPEKLNSLKKVATIESIGSSTRIEGVKLSNKEIEALLSNIGKESFKSRDEEEIAGYSDAMELIFESYNEIEFTENNLKQLHGVLLKHSSKDTRHRGEYKKFSNNVEAFDSYGKSLGIIFQTTSPFDTPKEMAELINWVNEETKKDSLHPLLIIAYFIVYFLAIHPFQDGNGRLSRVLTTLLLLKSGYIYVPYCSLERIIEENKDNYYLSLRRSQKEIKEKNGNIEKWLLFFLKSLQKQKNILDKKINDLKIITKLSKLSEDILVIAKNNEKVTISDLVLLTNSNRNTIKKKLKYLTENNYLEKHGKGKGSFYTLKFDI